MESEMSAKEKCVYCKRRRVKFDHPAHLCRQCWGKWFGLPSSSYKIVERPWYLRIGAFINKKLRGEV